ncbi:hypothetical protein B5G20_10015 [Collinsella sp. An7]|uniref:Rep family protein n=1 Tax=Collinsella sp. An7 TaxID=1965651 RepID=UPI000B382819|nr:Rep family protein [Collinsella sp. An7]OUN45197.1 hypothetical protein B5G20_10015 [Collinsella sp. An7]
MADSSAVKARYWTFLVYPESAPEDWLGALKRSHGSYAVSPLHQPDDETSKPHHHVIYQHGNTTTLNGAKAAIPEDVPANGYVEPVANPSNMQRYLIHLDDPEKEQFADGANSITLVNGFPLDLTRELSKSEKARIRLDLMSIIRENVVTEYSDFIFGLMDMGDPDMLDYACSHTILFEGVIRSVRNRAKVVQ